MSYENDHTFSATTEAKTYWEEQYKIRWKQYDTVSYVQDNTQQQIQHGRDAIIFLKDGKHYFVDEKLRRTIYDDLPIEIGNPKTGNPGWIKKNLLIDFLAYGAIGQQAKFIPFGLLQKAWDRNEDQWIKQFGTITAKSSGMVSCPVPWDDLREAIRSIRDEEQESTHL